MKFPQLKRTHLIVIGAVIIVVCAGGAYAMLRTPSVAYAFATAQLRPLTESVTATGQVKSANQVDLSFERSGRIAQVGFAVGATVKQGQLLLMLDNAAESAQVAQARAALNQREAGATDAQIAAAQASLSAAEADLARTQADTDTSVHAAQAALDTAKANLAASQGGSSNSQVENAYATAVSAVQNGATVIDASLSFSDSILGIDNPAASQSFKDELGAEDSGSVLVADQAYTSLRDLQNSLRSTVATLSATDQTGVDDAMPNTQTALQSASALLTDVNAVLSATSTSGNISATWLATQLATLSTLRSTVAAASSGIVSARNGIATAGASSDNTATAEAKAEQDLVTAEASAASQVQTKQALVSEAQANVDSAQNAPRAVDLAPLQAALQAAEVNYDKTILHAPFDGVVAKQDGTLGASILPGVPLVSVVSPSALQVDIYLSQIDVARVAVGQSATVTVDAFGDGRSFPAKIVSIDQTISTVNQLSGYKVTLQFEDANPDLKPGMTANVNITVASKDSALAVPSGSVIMQNNNAYVLVSQGTNAAPEKRAVTIGIESADGWTEIVSGLSASDQIVSL